MTARQSLPDDLFATLRSFLREDGDSFVVTDMRGLAGFVLEHKDAYPFLLDLLLPNEQAIIAHYKATGVVPPGVKIVETSTESGSNVTTLKVLRGKADDA